MSVQEIESLRKKIDSVNQNVNEKKANIKLLKEQLAKKLQELKDLGISGVDQADKRIKELEEEYNTLKTKIEKAIEHAEEQFRAEDELC